MPIYEYACAACGHQMEVMQSIKDEPLTQCPKCRKKKLQKLVSAAGFQLKGTGWYVTDFRNKGKPAAEGDKDKDKAKGEAETKSEEKSDAKPAEATEATDKAAKPSDKPEKKKKKKAAE